MNTTMNSAVNNIEAIDDEPVIETSSNRTAELMRWAGALAVAASAVVYMLQGLANIDLEMRNWVYLGLMAVMAGCGVAKIQRVLDCFLVWPHSLCPCSSHNWEDSCTISTPARALRSLTWVGLCWQPAYSLSRRPTQRWLFSPVPTRKCSVLRCSPLLRLYCYLSVHRPRAL